MKDNFQAMQIESLLTEHEWLRGLAKTLVFDGGEVDDSVQEAWISILRNRGNRSIRNPKAWLASVVRYKAADAARSKQSRTAREQERAAQDAQPSAFDLVARVEMQERVAQAILRLKEPDRSIVLLRFYEGLAPRAIAQRLGMPAQAVYDRTSRALEALRLDLDREFGERRHWALALLPWAALPGKAAGKFTFAFSAAALLLIGAGASMWLFAPPQKDVTTAPAVVVTQNESGDKPAPPPQGEKNERVSLAATESKDQAVPYNAPNPILTVPLKGRILNLKGEPVSGVSIGWLPSYWAYDLAESGILDQAFSAKAGDRIPLTEREKERLRQTREEDLVAQGVPEKIRASILDKKQQAERRNWLGIQIGDANDPLSAPLEEQIQNLRQEIRAFPPSRSCSDGAGVFSIMTPEPGVYEVKEGGYSIPGIKGSYGLLDRRFALVGSGWAKNDAGDKELIYVVSPVISVSGFVHDKEGNPVEGISVQVKTPVASCREFPLALEPSQGHPSHGPSSWWFGKTDREGKFTIDRVPQFAGARIGLVREGAANLFGMGSHLVRDLLPQQFLDLQMSDVIPLRQKSGPTIEGTVIDEAGIPIPDAALSLCGASARSDESGKFRLSGYRNEFGMTIISDGFPPGTLVVAKKGFAPEVKEGFVPEPQRRQQALEGGGYTLIPIWKDPQSPVTVTLHPASSISGQFFDVEGVPVAECAVQIADPTQMQLDDTTRNAEEIAFGDERGFGTVMTSRTGRFTITGLRDRPYSLIFKKTDSGIFYRSEPIVPGNEMVRIQVPEDFDLPVLSGIVSAKDGEPLEAVQISVQFPGSWKVNGFNSKNGWTDREGKFELRQIPAKGASLRFSGEWVEDRTVPIESLQEKPGLQRIELARRYKFRVEDAPTAAYFIIKHKEETIRKDGVIIRLSGKGGETLLFPNAMIELRDGRSDVLTVDESVEEIVLFTKNGSEWKRISMAGLVPEKLNRIVP